MDFCEDIKKRTFGIEIEMCNLERAKVSLPVGFSWSKDEQIFNTDATTSKKFGGEVNTPPLHLCSQKELHELHSVYESMVEAGGKIKWSIDTHVHIYAGDLSVEQLKKVFLFFYVCYPFFKKFAHVNIDEISSVNAGGVEIFAMKENFVFSVVLYPSSFENMDELLGDIREQAKKSDALVLAHEEDNEKTLLKLQKEIGDEFKIKSPSTSFSKILELAKERLMEIREEK